MSDSSSALERKVAEFEAMRKVVIAVNQSIQDLPTVWRVILTNACELVSARRGSLVLVDDANRTHLKIVATAGAGWTPEKLNCRLAVGDGITGKVAATGVAHVCGDTRSDPDYYALFENVRSELCVPVIGQEHILGIINIDSEKEDAFTQADVELLQMFAGHAAIALQNASQLAEARNAREEWRQVFESIQDGVLVCDLNFRVQRVNKAFCRMFSVGDSPVVGQDAVEFLARNMALEQNALWWQSLNDNGWAEQRIRDRSERSFMLTGTRSTLREERVWLLSFRETTQEDALQLKVVQAEKLAAMGQMVAGVAHELNNPLQVVTGFANLLEVALLDSPAAEQARLISREAERAARIVKHLLLFARSQLPDLTHLDVGTYVPGIFRDWRAAHNDPGVEMTCRVLTHETWINADRFHLTQVIHNLLHNAHFAVRSQPETSPRLIELEVGRQGEQVIITVRDNGPGIAPEHLRKIFDPFFTTKRPGKGTGLGLTICYSIVEQHGGKIWCESRPGEGTAFRIALPISVAIVGGGETEPGLKTLPSARVLLVDDEPALGLLFAEMLRQQNVMADFADTAVEGLSLLRQNRYDLVVSDLNMPHMTGREFLGVLKRENPEMAHRIVFATGELASEHQDLVRDGIDILYKPFSAEHLITLMSRKLSVAA